MSDIPQIREFPPTRWTMVSMARDHENPEAKDALAQICSRYWYPLYCFVRRAGKSHQDAENAIQDFFVHITKNLTRADRERGRLRTFFLQILKNQLTNDFRKETAQKRGGGALHESLNYDEADERFSAEPVDATATPEEYFEFVWAKEVMLRGLARVGLEWEARGTRDTFDAVKPLILSPTLELDPSVTRETVVEALNIKPDNLRHKIKSIRDRLWAIVALEVSGTLCDPDNPRGDASQELIAEEVAHIFCSLSTIGSEKTDGTPTEK